MAEGNLLVNRANGDDVLSGRGRLGIPSSYGSLISNRRRHDFSFCSNAGSDDTNGTLSPSRGNAEGEGDHIASITISLDESIDDNTVYELRKVNLSLSRR